MNVESSRVFVTNLPPNCTTSELKKHFKYSCPSLSPVITDCKLLPRRRIGFIGFKNSNDANSAVKNFDRSFIRSCRISVTIALSYGDTNLKSRHSHPKNPTGTPSNPNKLELSSGSTSNVPLSLSSGHKSEQHEPQLNEFISVMQAKSRSLGQVAMDSFIPEVYDQSLDTTSKFKSSSVLNQPSLPHTSTSQNNSACPPNNSSQSAISTVDNQPSNFQNDANMSNAEWLRSHSSGKLDLTESTGSSNLSIDKSSTSQPLPGDFASPNDLVMKTGRLFLRNLPFTCSELDIDNLMRPFNNLEEVHLPVDTSTGKPKGIAYVQFTSPDSALEAYSRLDGTIFQGRLLHILPSESPRHHKLNEFELAKLPVKERRQIQRKSQAAKKTFNWNSLYMSMDAIMESTAARLGVNKSDILDPTSADAAVKQAIAETHIIEETRNYFSQHGVDLEAFKTKTKGDTTILIKNFDYTITPEALKSLFEQYGLIKRLLMPPAGTIAIIEFFRADHAQKAFNQLAYRKIGSSLLYLEKAPPNLFDDAQYPPRIELTRKNVELPSKSVVLPVKPSADDLLEPEQLDDPVSFQSIFVKNLNFSTTTERLTEIFKHLTGFRSACVRMKPNPKPGCTPISMGFGFIEFSCLNDAKSAISAMNGYKLDGHELILKLSRKSLNPDSQKSKNDSTNVVQSWKTKIVIKNLPFEASKKDIRSLFSAYGQLRTIRLPKKFDSTSRGFAFAEFLSPQEAQKAVETLRNTHFLGRKLVLEFAAQDLVDPEAEIQNMQRKVSDQITKIAVQNLTANNRKKYMFNETVPDNEDVEPA